MIHLNNIHKSFGSLEVLKGIDLEIAKGEVVSIVGPSGAGKTTLLQIMGTLDRADSGQVIINDTDIARLGQKSLARFRNRQIGFVFQFHQLLPEFTALENVMIPGLIGGNSRKQTRQRALQLLDFMGLSERADHKPSELSGGETRLSSTASFSISVTVSDRPSLSSLTTKSSHALQIAPSISAMAK